MYYIGDLEIEALKKLFNKKKLFRYSSQYETECDQFEKEFSQSFNSPYSLILSSGTNSIFLALLASGIQPGDEVLIPTYTFVATAAAVIQAGAIPILVNVNENLSLDLYEARKKISEKTKALILVHMDGLSADIQSAKNLCDELKIIFIEDVAQAIGGSFENKKLGTFGDFGCYSLNESKIISCGEGGILTTNNKLFYEKSLFLHDTPLQFGQSKKHLIQDFEPYLGFSMRVSEIQGAIMRVQLRRLENILENLRHRKKIIMNQIAKSEKYKIINGYSEDGDCATTLHLQFNSPDLALKLSQYFQKNLLNFTSVISRPAHVSWKWTKMFGAKSHIQNDRNPFVNAKKNYSYKIANNLQSVDILTRTLRMEIDIELNEHETKELGIKINSLLESEL